MHKKFEINQLKIKVGCQSERKVVTHNSKSNLPLKKYTRAFLPQLTGGAVVLEVIVDIVDIGVFVVEDGLVVVVLVIFLQT